MYQLLDQTFSADQSSIFVQTFIVMVEHFRL